MLKARLATSSDDPQLREIISTSEMPGLIRLICRREPNFFESLLCHGKVNQAIVVESEKRIAGLIVRSMRNVYINGRFSRIGYLHSLRIRSEYRGSMVFSKGLELLHRLHHKDSLVKAYLVSLVNGNAYSDLLLSERFKMPRNFPLGRFCTYAFPLQSKRKMPSMNGVSVKKTVVTDTSLSVLNSIVRKMRAQKQFYPYLRSEEVVGRTFYLAYERGEIVGMIGLWDQHQYRQIAVAHLPPLLNGYFVWINGVRRLMKKRPYPLKGGNLSQLFISNVLIRDNDPSVFELLLTQAYNDTMETNEYDVIIIGLHEKDRLLEGLRNFKKIKYLSKLYLIFWDQGRDFVDGLNKDLVPYLEVGSL